MRFFFFLFVVLTVWGGNIPTPQASETRPFVLGSFEEIQKQHKGNWLIINLWSIRCPPCIAEMPVWSNVLEKYPELEIVLVSTDTQDDEKKIKRILDRYELSDVASWIFADPFIERLRYDIDKKWRGELPRTYFFNKKGDRAAHSGMVDAAALDVWLTGGAFP